MGKTITLKETKTKYSPTIESIIDELKQTSEPVILVQDDKPVAAVVPYAEYQHFSSWREKEESSRKVGDEGFERERAAFLRLKPELLKMHRGKFVAIHNEQVVDEDSNELELAKRVIKKKYDPVFIDLVSEEPHIVEIPSPEVVWHVHRL